MYGHSTILRLRSSGQASGKHDDSATYDGDGDNDEAHGALGRPLPLVSSTGDFPINPRDVEIYQDQHSFAEVVKDFEARRGIRQLPHLRETKHDLIVKLPQDGSFQASHIFIFIPSPVRKYVKYGCMYACLLLCMYVC